VTPLVNSLHAGRDAWLAARRKGIGASDVPAMLGLNPNTRSGPYALWADKCHGITLVEETEAMLWGRRFEVPILEEFHSRVSGVLELNTTLYQSEAHPLLLATPDAFLDGAPVQCKFSEFDIDEIPEYVKAQVQAEILVCGAPHGILVQLNPLRRKLEYRFLQPDLELQARIIEAAKEFWKRVETNSAPEPGPGEVERDAINSFYSEVHKDSTISLDHLQGQAARLSAVKSELKILEDEESQLTNAISAAMGENARGVTGDLTFRKAVCAARTEHCPQCQSITRTVSGHTRLSMQRKKRGSR
jgi:putative phage-type endonuclease